MRPPAERLAQIGSAGLAGLERRNAELELILDAIPALVIYKDSDNRIVRANRAAREALGANEAQLVGSDLRQWLKDGGEARHDAELEALRSGRAAPAAVESIELPGRGERWFTTARLPQRDAAGALVGLVVVSRDISDEQKLESKLLEAQKLDSIGRLAGGVAHDFNNLLTSFFGLITAAQRASPTDSTAHEYLSLMQLAVEGGANLTRQLLAFARRQVIEPRVVDLNRLVRETSALLRRVLGADIILELQLAADSVPVRVDPSQISQLLMNLALNARDAMAERGTLTFQTASVELDEPGRWSLAASPSGRFALLAVQDTGEGLSDEALEHLFEPFYTSKALGHGTGLGLATCYGIVKQNGGHIGVDSGRGRGARFSIYLPQVDAELEPARPDRRRAPVRAGNETVLLAEDDDLVRHLSVAALASVGYRMIEAAHGAEALRATEEHPGPIHLLITDVSMPEVGGIEVATRFRELRPEAAVLFISGYAGGLLAELGRLSGLNWAGAQQVEEIWVPSLDGTFTRERYYRDAVWMNATSVFTLEAIGPHGATLGVPWLVRAGRDDVQLPSDDLFIRRFDARQLALGCASIGDCSGASYLAEALVQVRGALHPRIDSRIVPPRTASLRLSWNRLPGASFSVDVDRVAQGQAELDAGFRVELEPVSAPTNGSFYEPGDAVSFRLSFLDGSGQRLHPVGSLPSYGDFVSGQVASGLRYLDLSILTRLYYALKHRESNLFVVLSGPTDQLRTPQTVVDPNLFFGPQVPFATTPVDGFTAIGQTVPPAAIVFGGLSDPSLWSLPVSDEVTFTIPSDAEAGTYVAAVKARRDFAGEALNRGATVDIQVGQAAPTVFTPSTACGSCHAGERTDFDTLLHGLDDRRACFGCHASLGIELDNALDIRVHAVHDRSNRFDADIHDCGVCHLTPPSGPQRGVRP